MRLLLLTHEFPPFRGGVGTYAAELAKAAAELGHQVTVYAPAYEDSLRSSVEDPRGVVVKRFPGSIYSSRHFPRLLATTIAALRKERYDVVHALDASFAMSLGFLHKFKRFAFRCTVHGSEILSHHQSRHIQFLRLHDLYQRPQRILANSAYTRELLLSTCPGVDARSVAVTALGVSPSWFEAVSDADRARMRTRVGAGPAARIVTTVARIIERKGHIDTIEALSRLPEDIRSTVVYAIVGSGGDPAYVAKVKEAAARSQVAVSIPGVLSTEDVRCLLSASQVFCMPGVPVKDSIEGFGLAYLEAAAQGVPSIATRLGGAAEAVAHERSGLVVAPGDGEALSRALNSLLADPELHARMKAGALAHAQEHSWRRVAELTYAQ